MPHNARVLCVSTEVQIRQEMKLVDVEPAGIAHMLPKCKHYVVKLQNIRRPIVHILKEAFLANGGDAAVSRDIITAAVGESDVLLIGTKKQFERALQSLLEQGFGCKELSVEIATAIANFDAASQTAQLPPLEDNVKAVFEVFGKRTVIMGILNVTPDSFSDGGMYSDLDTAVDRAMKMIEDGADIIDVGGESTRPGSEPVTTNEEIERVIPVIKAISSRTDTPISIDTYKADVAEAALDSGARIINDISAATFDDKMTNLIAKSKCPAILMHTKGTPRDMQTNATYGDLMAEISGYLRDRIRSLAAAGVDQRLLIIDPGIGFAKNVEHNLDIIRRLKELRSIGRPILIGTSRKSTIGKILGDLPPEDRLEGSAATVALSIANGADIVRVHDVREMTLTAKMTDAIVRTE